MKNYSSLKTKKIKHRITLMPLLFILIGVVIICFGVFIISGFKEEPEQPLLMQYINKEAEEYSVTLPASDYEYELFGKNLVADTNTSAPDSSITAAASLIYNITDREVVYSNNAYEKMYPASITKLTTLLVALQKADLTDEVTITHEMLSNLEYGSSLCGIKAGDVMTMNDLLYGLMLPSGNDAACAIAYHISGSEEEFAKLMNAEAERLGAVNTHYVNPHGLHNENHYTTAYDIYLIFNELLKYDKFHEIIGTQMYNSSYYDSAGNRAVATWGRGIWYFNNQAYAPAGITTLGGKTGTTTQAKYCLSLLSSDNNGDNYISIVLHAESRPLLYENMTNLLSKIDN